jgi:hypothetical protein
MKTRWFTSAGLLFLAFILPLALTRGRLTLPAAAANPDKAASLPTGSQGPISALIGADQSGYHARLDGTHFRMDNPEQGLSAEFSADGMQVSAGEHSWGMTLEGYGYGENLQPLPAVDPMASKNRIEYARGSLSEWYLNGPFGLEQGFTLASPPIGKTGGPLTLVLNQAGDLQAKLGEGGKELVLTAASGEAVLCYAGLVAQDADGRELKAWLETRTGVNGRPHLLLRLNDHAARYPLTVDPLIFVQEAKLTASDKAAYDWFGFAVAVSGDVVVIGSPYADPGGITNAGAAYVFVKPGGGWGNITQTAKLTASDKTAYDRFGPSVAISGNVVVIGAPEADTGGIFNAGAAYVFVKPAGGWGNMTQTAKLTDSDKYFDNRFGHSVSISGGVVVVGAPFADKGGKLSAGAAYVFVEPGGGWMNMTQTATLTASDKHADDNFGHSVAVSDDVVVVGAQYADAGGTSDAGAAYVFVEPGGGWGDMTQTAKLTASDKASDDWFGYSVAISGSVVVIGAVYADAGGTNHAGAAYVFVKPAGGWGNMTQTAKLTASDKIALDYFGFSVAISGGVVVVGAQHADSGGKDGAGAAYVFAKPAGDWVDMTERYRLSAMDKADDDRFGNSVAFNGSVIVVGAHDANPGGKKDAGAAYMFGKAFIGNIPSQGEHDGYIVESGESSSVGGTVNSTATTFRVGDNGLDRQYRSILSFNTSTIPDNAVITSVMLKIKKQGLVGTNPFTTHQGLKVDIRIPYFGTTPALEVSDFQAAASKMAVGTFGSTPVSGWYSVNLNSSSFAYINKDGITQFRLRFLLDDNDDMDADYVMFYSGNWYLDSHPWLVVEYKVP